MKPLITLLALAAIMWFAMFSPGLATHLNFWVSMVTATGILAGTSLFLQRHTLPTVYSFRPKFILTGILSALILYGIFFVGNTLSTRIFPFAALQIKTVYAIRSQGSLPFIWLLLFFWISPFEEVFWRGFVQEKLSVRYGATSGYLMACGCYAGVHIVAGNLMLCLAAFVCGLSWGWMFRRYDSVWPGIISHAVWGTMIFVLFPLSR